MAGGARMKPDVTVHGADELAADVEAEAGAANLADAGGVGAGEAAEEAAALVVGNTQALIADGDGVVAALAGGGGDGGQRRGGIVLWVEGAGEQMRQLEGGAFFDGAGLGGAWHG